MQRDRNRYLLSMATTIGGAAVQERQCPTLSDCKVAFKAFAEDRGEGARNLCADVFNRDSVEPDYCLHIGPKGNVVHLDFGDELKRLDALREAGADTRRDSPRG